MKKQIPNMLSVLRLIMIPVFIVIYFKYPEKPGPYWAAFIFFAAWATDVLDGYLARKNNWITEVGKIIDPLADKLMQFAVAICFTVDNRIFLMLLIPTVIKEICMAIGAVYIIKKHRKVEPSHWFGKAATVALFCCSMIRIIFRGNETLDLVLAIIMLAALVFAALMYYFTVLRASAKSGQSE